MNDRNLYDEMAAGMADLRVRLIDRWSWLSHKTPASNLCCIRKLGLEPKRVSGCNAEIYRAFGPSGDKIVCLHPLGADLMPGSAQKGPKMTLSIPVHDSPPSVVLDWSYSWDIVESRWLSFGNSSYDEFADGIVKEFGSLVCYEIIPAEKLRVRARGSSEDPSSWPGIFDVENDQIELIQPGLDEQHQ